MLIKSVSLEDPKYYDFYERPYLRSLAMESLHMMMSIAIEEIVYSNINYQKEIKEMAHSLGSFSEKASVVEKFSALNQSTVSDFRKILSA